MLEDIFPERVLSLRKARGLKQEELGDAVGLTKFAISDIERGKRLTSMEVLVALADFFDVSLDYLVGRSDDPKRH